MIRWESEHSAIRDLLPGWMHASLLLAPPRSGHRGPSRNERLTRPFSRELRRRLRRLVDDATCAHARHMWFNIVHPAGIPDGITVLVLAQ
jgi:hypothetical protein